MHAAEDDELRVGMAAHLAGELVGIAGVVGELDHLVSLIVMAEDHEPAAELPLRRRDAAVHLLVRKAKVPLGERLALGEVLLFVGRQDRKQCRHRACTLVKVFARGSISITRLPAGYSARLKGSRSLRF